MGALRLRNNGQLHTARYDPLLLWRNNHYMGNLFALIHTRVTWAHVTVGSNLFYNVNTV